MNTLTPSQIATMSDCNDTVCLLLQIRTGHTIHTQLSHQCPAPCALPFPWCFIPRQWLLTRICHHGPDNGICRRSRRPGRGHSISPWAQSGPPSTACSIRVCFYATFLQLEVKHSITTYNDTVTINTGGNGEPGQIWDFLIGTKIIF